MLTTIKNQTQAPVHFAFTGMFAGILICGEERTSTTRAIHPAATIHLPSKDTVCPICWTLWDVAGSGEVITPEIAGLWASLEDRQEWFAQALLDSADIDDMTADELCDRLNNLLMHQEA